MPRGLVPQEFKSPEDSGTALESIFLNKVNRDEMRIVTSAELDSIDLPINVKHVLLGKMGFASSKSY